MLPVFSVTPDQSILIFSSCSSSFKSSGLSCNSFSNWLSVLFINTGILSLKDTIVSLSCGTTASTTSPSIAITNKMDNIILIGRFNLSAHFPFHFLNHFFSILFIGRFNIKAITPPIIKGEKIEITVFTPAITLLLYTASKITTDVYAISKQICFNFALSNPMLIPFSIL